MRQRTALLAPLIATLAGFALASHAAVARRARETELDSARLRVVDAIDSERRRIQRDLHDTAQQRIVSVRIRLDMLSEYDALDRSAIATLGEDLDAALAEIRAVTVSHSPDVLWRDGLSAALRRVAARAPLSVMIDSQSLERLAPHVERQIYFCCLEALQNVFKHSGARHAWVRLRRRPGRFGFEVADDGRGFDPTLITTGEGFRNMGYRLAALGGRLSIDANPGTGTSLRGEVPIAESPDDRPRLLASVHVPSRRTGAAA
jgi:signal transduction histidine kinase